MKKIKLAICDDINYLCEYFQSVFENEEEFDFVGIANNTRQCLNLVKEKQPDVLLLDIQMEENDTGVEMIPKIKELHPEIKIIMLSIHKEDDYILRAFTYGANDYLTKTEPIDKIITAIKNVYNNTSSLRPELAHIILSECERVKNRQNSMLNVLNLLSKLSNSEFEILRALCSGDSYKNIAARRFVEESTIRSQVNRVLKKFDASNIKDLIIDLNNLKVFDIFDN